MNVFLELYFIHGCPTIFVDSTKKQMHLFRILTKKYYLTKTNGNVHRLQVFNKDEKGQKKNT